ncbi:hypothetical protein ACTXG6_04815 [Pseudonocardia sp. Cha107L01]|jgi:hypothetical protein|uniref:hypothetical protein n=1 Tax=Pseudonocardia sp. Cha107L01 TaxID=3457576 RepID=UPI00403EC702
MPVPTRGGARVARGLSAASVCALLTYGGHRAAGGALPDLGLLIVLALLLAGFLITLADRRRGPLAILVLVGGSQLALHGLLQLLGGSHEHTASAGSSGLPGSLAVPALMPVLMFGAHALATVITAAVLAGAEAAVFTVAHALTRVLPLSLSMPRTPEPPGRPGVVTGPLDARLRGVLGRRLHLRRGPPLRCPVTAGY